MNISKDPSTTYNISFQATKYCYIAQTTIKKLSRHMVPIFWHKPPEDKFKLNIDSSFELKTTNRETGGVIRNQLISTCIVVLIC